MGKSSRDKGARYEREIVNRLKEIGYDAGRHLEFQVAHAEQGRDLDGTDPFAIQCKCWKRMPPVSSLEQVEPDHYYPVPVAFLAESKVGHVRKEVAVLQLADFLRIMSLLTDEQKLELGENDFER